MIYRAFFQAFFLAALLAAGAAHAQYRWIDKDGSVKYTDAPPPAWAKDVRKSATPAAAPAAAPEPAAPPIPFELAEIQKNFPVTLYTAPLCKDACTVARGVLNKRGIPFTEISVYTQETVDKIKELTNSDQVPVLVVGRSVLSGYDSVKFDALLDSGGYPAAGVFPARSQAAPPMPEGFEAPPPAEPASTADTSPKGPYDTSGLQGPPPKPGQYDPSGLTGPPPKPGQYGLPAESK